MIEKTINIKKRFDELTDLIADPKIIADQKEWKNLLKNARQLKKLRKHTTNLKTLKRTCRRARNS